MKIEGKLAKIIYNNSENGYTVAVFDTDDGAISIAGSIAMPQIGTQYSLEGDFTIHRRYGEQFTFTSYEEALPRGKAAILEFLSTKNIRGIGPTIARLIVDTFEDDSLRIIEEEPERLLEIRGIGVKSLAKIVESSKESREFAKIALRLRELGLEMSEAVRIYKLYGSASEDIVRENPYVLVEDIRGINFPRADEIASKLGFDFDSELRIESGIRYVLQQWASSGSTLMNEEKLVLSVTELLDSTRERVRDTIGQLVFNGELEEESIDEELSIYLYGYYMAEQRIAYNLKCLREAARKPIPASIDNLIRDAEASLSVDEISYVALSDRQREAVASCLEHNVSIITGGPGTGKTTIINTLVRIFKRLGFEVALAAPTGRAAKRMEEASGEVATTIHRLLEFVFSEDDKKLYFGRNEENQLEQDVIIVDEASMIDTMLMDGLLRATKVGTILIFTGDADQLPSVGAGNVLRDMIASDYIHTTKLTEIFRQSEDSKIIVNSHRINQGEYPEQGREGSDFFILPRSSEDAIIEAIKEMVEGRLARGVDFIKSADDIQILTPTKQGVLGAPNLNTILQEIINPKDEFGEELRIGSKVFRRGDRVMQLKNDYNAEWKDDDDWTEGRGIFNGDMGIVESIDLYDKSMLVRSDGRLITYEGEMFDEVDLAYAVTVHKSQGSEFPAVIIPAWWFRPMLLTRNLLYTAITRGKKLVLIIGDPRCVRRMIDNNHLDERQTGLKHMLNQIG